jgi:hypothetical protein
MDSKQILAAFGIASTLFVAGPATGRASTGAGAPPAVKPAPQIEVIQTEETKTSGANAEEKKAVDRKAEATKAEATKEETKPGVMTVTTKDYTFTVHTPEGWTGDTENAKKYQGSIYFSQKSEAATPGGAKVLVGIYHKFDENVGLRLETEIQNYRKEYPKLELGELNIKHPRYDTFQKVLSQSGDFYQYVTYLNPGNLYSYSLFVAMSKKKTPATPAELAAYKDIVQSLQMTPPSSKPTQ